MRQRTEAFQRKVLTVCAGLLIGLTGLKTAGVQLPGAEMFAATTTLIVLGMLYMLSYRSTRQEILSLQTTLVEVQKRENLSLQLAESLARAIDARDQRGRGRAERVRDLAMMLAEDLGLSEEEMEELRIAALLADVGKLAIPDHILSKPGPLTEEELRKVRTHPVVGASILAGVRFSGGVTPIVRGHHEWFDGSGYPDGLKGEQIPLGARVLTVADVYDALLSDRPHRRALSAKQAADIMEKSAGIQFDPRVVAACFRVLSREKARERFGFIFDAHEGTGVQAKSALSEHERTAFADIAQAQRELLALFEIVQTTATSLNVQETLDLLMSKTRKIVNFASGVIFSRESPDGDLRAAATSGLFAAELQGQRIGWAEGVSGQAAALGRSSTLNAEAQQDLCRLLKDETAEEAKALVHAAAVPLFSEQAGVCGTITLYRPEPEPFSEDDLRLLSTVAAQASIAISKARAFEQTERTALTDVLTGLPNARYLFMHLESEMARAGREGKPLSLLLMDIDGFKSVNDRFGHQQGDRVLRELAAVFRVAVREYDVVARYGGDEFFVLLPATPNQEALETTLRIKEAVEGYKANLGEKDEVYLRVSIGVATFPGDATEPKALLAVADKAMYADKGLQRRQLQLLNMMTADAGQQGPVAPRERDPVAAKP